MALVRQQVWVERRPAVLFALVDLCEDYPRFLPWCGGAVVHERSASHTDATLWIDFHGVKASFRTVNEKRPPREMVIRLREGPFRHLHGFWRYVPLGDSGCRVEFELHYAFSSRLLERVIGPVFNRIAETFVSAFVTRAEQLSSEEERSLIARVPGLEGEESKRTEEER
ncbi:MAG: type II toxin-antitoxin system RatA family toxin [Hydrogenophilus sp.]|nr:type II toxin-antitoxin system RatA family toxin [Hydrogenophilus sp.]